MPTQELQRFFDQLKLDGVLKSDAFQYEALTGGVSSEIYKVSTNGSTFVVKRALKQLKVEAHWEADLSRNTFEVRYLNFVSSIIPDAVPRVIFEGDGYFVMEYLGTGFTNWKAALLKGELDPLVAERLGTMVGRVHELSSHQTSVQRDFQSLDNFKQLRISPYIDHLVEKHPQLEEKLSSASQRLANASECLVHGDLSPKNILFTQDRAVLLDCEVAWFGDPAFDLSFLINHLCLKSLYHMPRYIETREIIERFLECYFRERKLTSESKADLETCAANLLDILLLARADGKSPVEYLDEKKFAFIRAFAVPRIEGTAGDLNSLLDDWFRRVESLCQL